MNKFPSLVSVKNLMRDSYEIEASYDCGPWNLIMFVRCSVTIIVSLVSTSLRLWKLISRHREQRDEMIINLKIRGKLPTDVDPCVPRIDIKIRQKPSVGLK